MTKPPAPVRCACGAAGKRDCPAIKAPICPVCCASKRGPGLACPADCPHYPLGSKAHDQWRRLDQSVTEKTLRRVIAASPSKNALRDRIEAFAKDLSRGEEPDESDVATASMMVVHQAMFLDRDGDGQSLADKWEKAGWEGLNNDERTAMDFRRNSHPTVIEFQRPLDAHDFQCVDLLDPDRKPFNAIAFSARSTPRYTRSLAWVCHLHHFSLIGPVGVIVPSEVTEDLISSIRAKAKKKAGLFGRADLKGWLLDNFVPACKLLDELLRERQAKLLASIDAHQCHAKYRLKTPAAGAAAILKARDDFASEGMRPHPGDGPDTVRLVWLRKGKSADAESPKGTAGMSMDSHYGGVPVIGSVTVEGDKLILETFARWKFDYAKKKLASIFGKDIEPLEEKITDMRELLAKRQAGDASPQDTGTDAHPDDAVGAAYDDIVAEETGGRETAPRMTESERRRILGRHLDEHYRKTLDEPIPMLKNKTPRQAAKDSSTRPLLIEWAKGLLHDLDRQRLAGNDSGTDLRWLFEELDLKELL